MVSALGIHLEASLDESLESSWEQELVATQVGMKAVLLVGDWDKMRVFQTDAMLV